jgi:hypothetical protein
MTSLSGVMAQAVACAKIRDRNVPMFSADSVIAISGQRVAT